MVHISTLDLKKIKTAAKYRKSILKRAQSCGNAIDIRVSNGVFGKDVKMVHRLTIRPRILSETEKTELEVKYKDGMTMVALADIFGCHYTTVGRILRKRSVTIRK
jgi:hypothetical protein